MGNKLDMNRPASEVLSELAENLLDREINPHGADGEIALEVSDTHTGKEYTLNIRLTERPKLELVKTKDPVQH